MDVNKIYNMLDDKSIENRMKGIEEGKKIKDLSVFFQPLEKKEIWDDCARIIASHTDEELRPYLPLALEWFEDANWPGYIIIRDRLRKMNADCIYEEYSKAIRYTYQIQDWLWMYWLSELLTIPGLREKLNAEESRMLDEGIRKSEMEE